MPLQAPPADFLGHGVVSPTARWPQSKSYSWLTHYKLGLRRHVQTLKEVSIDLVVAKVCLIVELTFNTNRRMKIVTESVRMKLSKR